MTNDTTHEPCLLQEPEYIPAQAVDNRDFDRTHTDRFSPEYTAVSSITQMSHYHVNMAAFLKLAEWFDFLRQQQVYDHTRIILVSDHGWNLNQMGLIRSGDAVMDKTCYHPLLMYKDFGSSQPLQTDTAFMTNADTPSLAASGLIPPINPFTGNPLDTSASHRRITVIGRAGWDVGENNGNVLTQDHWYSVHDNIFVPENWEYVGIQ